MVSSFIKFNITMAKFEEVFEDTQALFTNYVKDIENLRNVKIKVLANNRLKEITKVAKANDLLKFMTDEDVIVLINESVFENLDDEQKLMVVEEAVTRIYFDEEKEKEKVVLSSPDINTFSLLLRKYGYAKYETLHETIKAVFAQKEEEEAENEQ